MLCTLFVKLVLKLGRAHIYINNFLYLCAVLSMLKAHMGIRGGVRHIHIIKAYLALWFWHSENFATSMVSQKQGNENVSWVYSITAIVGSWCICAPPKVNPLAYKICIHIRGAFSVARFDLPGNAKAFRMWNEWQDWLHVFYFCMIANNNRQGGAIGTNPI